MKKIHLLFTAVMLLFTASAFANTPTLQPGSKSFSPDLTLKGDSMIKPTVGRMVHFYPDAHDGILNMGPDIPLAATIAAVHSDTMVNLTVSDAYGNTHGRTSIVLLQPEDPVKPSQSYCAWMPYQKGQAQKTEELENKLHPV